MSQCFIKQICKKKKFILQERIGFFDKQLYICYNNTGVFFVATVQKNVDGYEKHAMPKPHPVSSASHLK